MKPANKPSDRRGVVAVEAAVVLPLLIIMMLGVWEVSRIIQVKQIMVNSAREGARLAAGGYTVNSQPVTPTMVTQAVKDYLRGAGMPANCYNNAQVTLTCLATPSWVNPSDAHPMDKFRLNVRIPAGAAFESTRWSFLPKITGATQMDASVDWVSLNNTKIVVDTNLPL